jgi:hypothetical protein
MQNVNWCLHFAFCNIHFAIAFSPHAPRSRENLTPRRKGRSMTENQTWQIRIFAPWRLGVSFSEQGQMSLASPRLLCVV